jgi:hypothetical protein
MGERAKGDFRKFDELTPNQELAHLLVHLDLGDEFWQRLHVQAFDQQIGGELLEILKGKLRDLDTKHKDQGGISHIIKNIDRLSGSRGYEILTACVDSLK